MVNYFAQLTRALSCHLRKSPTYRSTQPPAQHHKQQTKLLLTTAHTPHSPPPQIYTTNAHSYPKHTQPLTAADTTHLRSTQIHTSPITTYAFTHPSSYLP